MIKQALAFSLALHGVLFLVIWQTRQALPPPEVSLPIEVVAIPKSAGGGGRGPGGGKGGGGKPWSQLSWSDLGIQPGGGTAGEGPRELGAPGSGRYGTGGDLLGAMKGTVLFENLFERVDNRLHYPKEFLDAGIEGKVTVEAIFSPQGKYLEKKTRFVSTSRYLRVFVIRLLREVFTEPLPGTYLRHRLSELLIKFVFQFDVRRRENLMTLNLPDANLLDGRKPVIGNQLAFYRAGGVVGQWKLGPIHGYGIAPAIGLDPEELVDGVASLFKKKQVVDPLEKYRMDPRF